MLRRILPLGALLLPGLLAGARTAQAQVPPPPPPPPEVPAPPPVTPAGPSETDKHVAEMEQKLKAAGSGIQQRVFVGSELFHQRTLA